MSIARRHAKIENSIPGLKIPIGSSAKEVLARAISVKTQNMVSKFNDKDIDKYKEFQETYFNDFAGFAIDCINWRDNENGPTLYQLRVLDRLLKERRLAVRSLHGAGKTTLLSWLVLCFSLTRDGRDWKIITTASAWSQLKKYLWPEIHKWSRRLNWEKIGRQPFTVHELLTLSLKLNTGEAFAVSCSNPASLEGAHAEDDLLYIFDEAKAIPDETFDAAEGAFSGNGNCYAIAVSTPGVPIGRFHDINTQKPGYEDWSIDRITLEDVIRGGRTTKEWADQRKLQWGESSALYKNKVLGEFAVEENGIISLSYVERSNDLHADWLDENKGNLPNPTVIGVDIGISVDKTILAYAIPGIITKIEEMTDTNADNATMLIAGKIKVLLDKYPSCVVVIDIGNAGSGVAHRLIELGYKKRVISFNFGSGTGLKDRLNEFGFLNKRAAIWWMMKEALHPQLGDNILLPEDDELLGELTALHKKRITSSGLIVVESKDDIKKRIKRSTDKADAVLMALFGKALYSTDGFKPIDLGARIIESRRNRKN